jgi:DNA-binding XRE family transcriptional regulator
MHKHRMSPVGMAVADARQQSLADDEYRKLRARLSVAEAVARVMIQFRMKLNLTQEQLAQLMDTTASAISRLEGGRHVPSLATLARAVEAEACAWCSDSNAQSNC